MFIRPLLCELQNLLFSSNSYFGFCLQFVCEALYLHLTYFTVRWPLYRLYKLRFGEQ
jgi:hypothetical protein